MKIEEGKRYIRKDGKITEPAVFDSNQGEESNWICNGPEGFIAYNEKGKCCINWHDVDLVSEYIESPFTIGQTYQTAERGEVTCIALREDGGMFAVFGEHGNADSAYCWTAEGEYMNAVPMVRSQYRIVFTPVRKTVTKHGFVSITDQSHDISHHTFNITFDLVDGKPDWDNAKVTPAL